MIAGGKPKWEAAWERFRRTRNPLKDSLPASELDAAALPSDVAWLSLCRLGKLAQCLSPISCAAFLTTGRQVIVYTDRYEISGIAYIPAAKRDKRFIVRRACIGAPEPMVSQCLRVTPIAHPFDPSK